MYRPYVRPSPGGQVFVRAGDNFFCGFSHFRTETNRVGRHSKEILLRAKSTSWDAHSSNGGIIMYLVVFLPTTSRLAGLLEKPPSCSLIFPASFTRPSSFQVFVAVATCQPRQPRTTTLGVRLLRKAFLFVRFHHKTDGYTRRWEATPKERPLTKV